MFSLVSPIGKGELLFMGTSTTDEPNFDPIFRLFTVIYGSAFALLLKPFADALSSPRESIMVFAADWTATFLLLAFAGFLIIDWFWAAAYLINFWPTKDICGNHEHPFFKAFYKHARWKRGAVLGCHFAFTGCYAVATSLAWSREWKPFEGKASFMSTSSLFWLGMALLLATVWDMLMYIGDLEVAPAKFVDHILARVYQLYSFIFLLFVGLLLAFPIFEITGKGVVGEFWSYRKPIIAWGLAFNVLLRIVTYMRIPTLVKVKEQGQPPSEAPTALRVVPDTQS